MELIDRQALKAAHGLGTDCCNCKQSARSCQYDREFSRMDFCEWLDDAPTIDAVPVRHGEWEQVEVIAYDGISMNDDAVRCAVCGHVEQSVYWARTYYHYCPNCGARMDRKEVQE